MQKTHKQWNPLLFKEPLFLVMCMIIALYQLKFIEIISTCKVSLPNQMLAWPSFYLFKLALVLIVM